MHRTELSPRPARLKAYACALLMGIALLLTLAGCGGSSDSPMPEGSWSGVVTDQYVCEAETGWTEIAITWEGDTLTFNSALGNADIAGIQGATASVTDLGGGAYQLALDTPAITGTLLMEPMGRFAAIVLEHPTLSNPVNGVIGVLSKGEPVSPTYADGDILGTWSGTTAYLAADFTIASSGASNAIISDPGNPHMIDGEDAVGTFSGSVDPLYNNMLWKGDISQEITFELGILLSPDKSGAAVVVFPDDCASADEYTFPIDLRFALWGRQ